MKKSNSAIKLPFYARAPVLATGSESNSSFAVLSGDTVFISDTFADLKDPVEFDEYRSAIVRQSRAFKPRVIACDLHPEYMSAKYARDISGKGKAGRKPLVEVQHHHAHAAGCMAENGLRGKAIAVVFDGTGYGSDGNVWGGEFLIAGYGGFERRGHLAYVRMPGGDKAVLEPMRMALSYLRGAYGSRIKTAKADVLRRMGGRRMSLFLDMMDKDINSPLTSSAGRLFDAVSSLVGARDRISFQGEAAIELEKTAAAGSDETYDFNIKKTGGEFILEFWPMIRMIVGDLKKGRSPGVISRKFHNTVAEAVKDMARRIRRKTGLKNVVLSGGVFLNRILLREAVKRLEAAGFSVYTHKKTSCSDSGLSLGQAVIAAKRRKVFP